MRDSQNFPTTVPRDAKSELSHDQIRTDISSPPPLGSPAEGYLSSKRVAGCPEDPQARTAVGSADPRDGATEGAESLDVLPPLRSSHLTYCQGDRRVVGLGRHLKSSGLAVGPNGPRPDLWTPRPPRFRSGYNRCDRDRGNPLHRPCVDRRFVAKTLSRIATKGMSPGPAPGYPRWLEKANAVPQHSRDQEKVSRAARLDQPQRVPRTARLDLWKRILPDKGSLRALGTENSTRISHCSPHHILNPWFIRNHFGSPAHPPFRDFSDLLLHNEGWVQWVAGIV